MAKKTNQNNIYKETINKIILEWEKIKDKKTDQEKITKTLLESEKEIARQRSKLNEKGRMIAKKEQEREEIYRIIRDKTIKILTRLQSEYDARKNKLEKEIETEKKQLENERKLVGKEKIRIKEEFEKQKARLIKEKEDALAEERANWEKKLQDIKKHETDYLENLIKNMEK